MRKGTNISKHSTGQDTLDFTAVASPKSQCLHAGKDFLLLSYRSSSGWCAWGGVGGRLHSLKLSETHDNWGFTQLVLPTFPELQGREMAAHIWFLKFH